MWCVPIIDDEFKERMEDILELYQKPYNPQEPVICFDEKSKQLLSDAYPVIPARKGISCKRDYQYKRHGTRNIFMSVEPKAGYRTATATQRRTKQDFAKELQHILHLPRYRKATRLHFVLDNLNTHFAKSILETFKAKKATQILSRIRFHYTPKHASWLNMAEIELSIVSRQALQGRIANECILSRRLSRWQRKRNKARAIINWKFTTKDARKVFRYNTMTNII